MTRKIKQSTYFPDWHRGFPNSLRMTERISRMHLRVRLSDHQCNDFFFRLDGLSEEEIRKFLDEKKQPMKSLGFEHILDCEDGWVHYICWDRIKENEVVDRLYAVTQILEVNTPVDMKVDRRYDIRVRDRNGKLNWGDEGMHLLLEARKRADAKVQQA